MPPFITAVTVDDPTAILWSSANFRLKGALLITDIALLQLLLPDD